jgi:hypothetical protein
MIDNSDLGPIARLYLKPKPLMACPSHQRFDKGECNYYYIRAHKINLNKG